ncbi:hypothetical protein AAC387_Pa10g0732 [Persea americana]
MTKTVPSFQIIHRLLLTKYLHHSIELNKHIEKVSTLHYSHRFPDKRKGLPGQRGFNLRESHGNRAEERRGRGGNAEEEEQRRRNEEKGREERERGNLVFFINENALHLSLGKPIVKLHACKGAHESVAFSSASGGTSSLFIYR